MSLVADELTNVEIRTRLRKLVSEYRGEFERYAARNLKIVYKAGGDPQPFKLNFSQRVIHAKLQEQLKQTGMVRAVIVKARQLGCSTYVAGRFYHRCSLNKGTKAFILTHLDEATNNLFEMVNRYHDHMNPLLKPVTGKANAKELTFSRISSGYRVGTAGSTAVGRSATIQLFHGSEVGYWPNADLHAGGVLQTVPIAPGTEVILESTAAGMLNYFHDRYKTGAARKDGWLSIFVPWFWGEDYRLPAPKDFELNREEDEIAQAFGLDRDQMFWRRTKLAEFKEPWRFMREYPATPEEAFQSSGEGNYIKPIRVAKARKTVVIPMPFVPIVIGIDPARGGRDKTAVVDRQGRRAGFHICEEWDESDSMSLCGKIVKLILRVKPKKIVIDATEGTGSTVYDRLVELGYGKLVEPVKFSEAAFEDDLYANKRAEMWAAMKDWFDNAVGVQVPNEPEQIADDLQAQICAPMWGAGATKHRSNGQLVIEEKEHIVKRLKRSPDLADALAMTFALPITSASQDTPTVTHHGPADAAAGY